MESTVVDHPPPMAAATDVYDDGLPIPPMDSNFLSQNDVVLDDIDFDFSSFDDLYIPSFDDAGGAMLASDHEYPPELFGSNASQFYQTNNASCLNAFKTTSPEFPNSTESPISANGFSRVLNSSSSPEICQFSGDISVYLNVNSPESNHLPDDRSCDVSVYVDVPSPESNGSNKGSSEAKVSNCPSPLDSQGSGNCGSNLSEEASNRSVYSSPDSDRNLIKNGVVDQEIRLQEYVKNEHDGTNNNSDDNNSDSNKNCLLKRKKGSDSGSGSGSSDIHINNDNVDSRMSKYRKASNSSQGGGDSGIAVLDEDEKRKARLMRNRESAQLSRQRKKHYVEELEDKVRNMHSTIQDLNAKISYVMTENATLRQQLGGGAVQTPMAPPPGMYPPPPMMYPWMPVPPYMMKPQGSQVPLVPIPRLKPQQAVSATKISKKADSKKGEVKTKKVASISFLGLLFFILLFGGLVPMVHMKFGATRETLIGGSNFVGNGLYDKHRGRVLSVNGSGFGNRFNSGPDLTSDHRGHGGGEPNFKYEGDESAQARNGSEPLMASLYVPRNNKLVKIDGNLIIHSVLASEKAMASHEESKEKKSDETGLAVRGHLAPAVPVPGMGINTGRNPRLALGSSYGENEKVTSTATDRRLQQWFREGLAGPMLSSGMCTEVFQFEVASAPGAIIPAASSKNVSESRGSQNSTHLNRGGRNRRILHGVPIPLPGSSSSSWNLSEQHSGRDSREGSFNRTGSSSSMVVSVLVDPREAADATADGDDVMGGAKSLSRIFVVVLVDSVKYVTYSCVLPFIKGSGTHLVTA